MKVTKTITFSGNDGDGPVDCSGGYCPSFLLTDDGQVLVQGYRVASEDKPGLEIPSGEDMVSMPLSTLRGLIERLGHE